MELIFELFPVVCGIALGLVMTRLRPARLRAATWVVGSIGLGLLATLLSGEWRLGWLYLLYDIPAVALASAMASCAPRGWAASRRALQRQTLQQ